jgi:hypothetical protein
MDGDDPFDLQRFVDAQDGGVYEQALGEIRAGEKRSHWMWSAAVKARRRLRCRAGGALFADRANCYGDATIPWGEGHE